MNNKLLAIVAAVLLTGPMAANAIIVTWDDLNPTVVRPSSGSTYVDFFATVTLDPGESIIGAGANHACLTECLAFDWGSGLYSTGYGARFRATVDSTDPTGLYDSGPVGFLFHYSDASGQYLDTQFWRYTVNVVDSVSVPEPATLGLFGLGFAGLALRRRRRTA